MATTDQAALNTIQYRLIETPNSGASMTSDLWTITELAAYLSQRQDRFIADARACCAVDSQAVSLDDQSHDLPETCLRLLHALWKDTATGTWRDLFRASAWEIDCATPLAQSVSAARPKAYLEVEAEQNTIRTYPPAAAGTLESLYLVAGTALSNSGVAFLVPDDFVPAIIWGALADALGKSGRGQDLQRAAYCEQRFAEGVELARLTMLG